MKLYGNALAFPRFPDECWMLFIENLSPMRENPNESRESKRMNMQYIEHNRIRICMRLLCVLLHVIFLPEWSESLEVILDSKKYARGCQTIRDLA